MNNFLGTFKNKNRPPFILIWLGWMIGAILQIIDGVIVLLTLGMVFSNFSFKWALWNARKTNDYWRKKKETP